MDKFGIRKEIAALINSIKEHSDNIGDKQHIPQLELELILQKIEKLYKKSIVFNHLNTQQGSHSDRSVPEPKAEDLKEEPIAASKVTSEKPIDLFGAEMPLSSEKVKVEKKTEKKEEKKEVRKEEPPVLSKAKLNSIPDLKAAIGINDKFQFANELFAGNMQEYTIAIHQLNSSESLESAMFYFESLQQLYEWDAEHETVKRLVGLVDRRYS